MSYRAKVIHNKSNNQLFIALSRKKLKISQKKVPKFFDFENFKMED